MIDIRNRGGAVRAGLSATLLLAWLTASQGVSAEDWPGWRGPRHTGIARADGVFDGPFELRVRWRARLGSGYSAVSVAGSTAITAFSDGATDYLVALDADSGTERWRRPLDPAWPGREGATDGPVSTPAIDGGAVYALSPRGRLVAVDLRDGSVRWEVRLPEAFGTPVPHWGFGTSPLPVGDAVVVQAGGPTAAIAFERTSGRVLWRAEGDDVSYQSPLPVASGGRARLLVAGDRYLFGIDPADGQMVGRYEHGGEGFYRRIINPVPVGEDRYLITHRPEEATLLRLKPHDEGLGVETVWTTPHLKRNYAQPVFHEGYLYGFSGSLLSCVDAATGQRAWRSRPPGNGFPLLAGDHLIVLTKSGTLAVARASPDGYDERARLQLFDDQAWTPPSFAGGRIYARDSFGEVAAVDVVPVSIRPTAGPVPAAGTGPATAFERRLARIASTPDADPGVRELLDDHPNSPVIDGSRADIWYLGEGEDLVLRGTHLEENEEIPLRRVGRTGLHAVSVALERDARIVYQLERDLGERLPDPRNPVEVPSAKLGGRASLLIMPDGRPVATAEPNGPRGRVESVPFASPRVRVGAKTWGGPRDLRVWLPPGYDSATDRYPTLYVLYGNLMLDSGKLDRLLDRYVGRDVTPLIVVFVASISPYEYARTQREVHARMLVEQVVPAIDARYRTLEDPGARGVLGVDEAGYAALYLGLDHPETFRNIAAQSVYPVWPGGAALLERIATAPRRESQWYLDWGRYDARSRPKRLDVPDYGRRLRQALVDRGYTVHGREWNDGSDIVLWVARAEESLRALFPASDAP